EGLRVAAVDDEAEGRHAVIIAHLSSLAPAATVRRINRFHRCDCRSDRWGRRVEESLLPWVLRDADLGADVLEVGPGPGRTTAVLQERVQWLAAIELAPVRADSLRRRLDGGAVTVVEGDATAMPFEDGRFSAAVCFTMLHHVPSVDLQDQ